MSTFENASHTVSRFSQETIKIRRFQLSANCRQLAVPQHRCKRSSSSISTASEPMAPPGFCNRREVRYGPIGSLEYEVPQSRLYCLCINVALCSTALQCICRVIRRNSMTMKAHTYYIIFGRPPIPGKLPPDSATVSGARGRLFAYGPADATASQNPTISCII